MLGSGQPAPAPTRCPMLRRWSPVAVTTTPAELSLERSLEPPEAELEISPSRPMASLLPPSETKAQHLLPQELFNILPW